MTSQVDQKRAFNKLKHDLEPWRSIIVQLDAVLGWEKNFYPGIIAAVISVLFLILWALDLSTITMLSLVGLAALLMDYVYPSVSRLLFNPDNWNGDQEEQFSRVCNNLCNCKAALAEWYEYIFTAKERKSTLFVIVVCVALLFLAWIGAIINNLLLMYLLVLSLAMYPGMQKNSIFQVFKDKFGGVINSKLQLMKEKTNKTE